MFVTKRDRLGACDSYFRDIGGAIERRKHQCQGDYKPNPAENADPGDRVRARVKNLRHQPESYDCQMPRDARASSPPRKDHPKPATQKRDQNAGKQRISNDKFALGYPPESIVAVVKSRQEAEPLPKLLVPAIFCVLLQAKGNCAFSADVLCWAQTCAAVSKISTRKTKASSPVTKCAEIQILNFKICRGGSAMLSQSVICRCFSGVAF